MVKCGCSKYKAGDLRARIVIERKTNTADDYGGYTEGWAEDPAGGVWAAWKALSGREGYTGQREAPFVTVRAAIRFRGDANGAPYYTPKDRVTYRGREYGIKAVRDPDDRQRWLELDLVETDAS